MTERTETMDTKTWADLPAGTLQAAVDRDSRYAQACGCADCRYEGRLIPVEGFDAVPLPDLLAAIAAKTPVVGDVVRYQVGSAPVVRVGRVETVGPYGLRVRVSDRTVHVVKHSEVLAVEADF